MTVADVIGVDAGFIARYLHYAVVAFSIGGVVLYALVEKKFEKTEKLGAYAAMQWGVNGGSIPICVAYIAVAFNPDLWVALQDYYVLASAYAAYHLAKMMLIGISKIKLLFKSGRPPKE